MIIDCSPSSSRMKINEMLSSLIAKSKWFNIFNWSNTQYSSLYSLLKAVFVCMVQVCKYVWPPMQCKMYCHWATLKSKIEFVEYNLIEMHFCFLFRYWWKNSYPYCTNYAVGGGVYGTNLTLSCTYCFCHHLLWGSPCQRRTFFGLGWPTV